MNLVTKQNYECRWRVLIQYYTIKSIADELGYTTSHTYGLVNGTHTPTDEAAGKLDKMLIGIKNVGTRVDQVT